jgi:predicted RecA/RadA family phage recombinase
VATNYKHSGKRITIDSASTGGVTSGIPCVQEGFFGIPMTSAAAGESFVLAIEGVWNIAVPASTVKGDILMVPSTAQGRLLTEDNDVVAGLTRTSATTVAPVCKALSDRDAAGYADVLILAPGASTAGQQA